MGALGVIQKNLIRLKDHLRGLGSELCKHFCFLEQPSLGKGLWSLSKVQAKSLFLGQWTFCKITKWYIMTIIIWLQNSCVLCSVFSTGCPFFPCLVHCAPGEFLESNILCKPCPIGSYSPGVVMNKTMEKCARLAMQCIIFCLMIMHTIWVNSLVHATERQRIIHSFIHHFLMFSKTWRNMYTCPG